MLNKKVKELMIGLSSYPKVHKNSTLIEAIQLLEKSQENLPEDLQPFRAVLVTDDDNSIIGKVGHLAFLKSLAPQFNVSDDNLDLQKANLSQSILESMESNINFWEDNLLDVCSRVNLQKIGDIMHPVNECIDEDESVAAAIHKLIHWQSLSVLVCRDNEITGIIRLTDLYKYITDYIGNNCNKSK